MSPDTKKSRPLLCLAALFALYLLSAVPVAILTAWLAAAGVVPQERAFAVLNTIYAPLDFAGAHSPAVRAFYSRIDKYVIGPLAPSDDR
jgi:hypothetical protein